MKPTGRHIDNDHDGKCDICGTNLGGSLPGTGMLWWPVPVLLLIGLALLLIGLKARKSKQ